MGLFSRLAASPRIRARGFLTQPNKPVRITGANVWARSQILANYQGISDRDPYKSVDRGATFHRVLGSGWPVTVDNFVWNGGRDLERLPLTGVTHRSVHNLTVDSDARFLYAGANDRISRLSLER